MQIKRCLQGAVVALNLLTVSVAQAHTVASDGTALLAGFSHPLLGWDHLLAVLAIGLWSVQQNRYFVWRLPLVFLGMVTVGAVFAGTGLALPGMEPGIAGSLLVLGLLIAFSVRLPTSFSAGMVGLFALIHGLSHVAEVRPEAAAMTYGLGFVLATSVLQVFGVRLGQLCRAALSATLLRLGGGGAIAATGVLSWV